MRENEGQVDLVGSLGVSSPAEGKVPRCSPSSRSDETKRRHSFVADQDVRDSELALPSSPTPGNAGWSSHVYTLTPRNESRRQSEFPKLHRLQLYTLQHYTLAAAVMHIVPWSFRCSLSNPYMRSWKIYVATRWTS